MPQEHGKDESQRRAFPPLIPLLCKGNYMEWLTMTVLRRKTPRPPLRVTRPLRSCSGGILCRLSYAIWRGHPEKKAS